MQYLRENLEIFCWISGKKILNATEHFSSFAKVAEDFTSTSSFLVAAVDVGFFFPFCLFLKRPID